MLFTVVIPVFNSSDYILDTLKSVQVASRSSDYEIILIDDCSADVDKLKSMISLFNNVRLIEKINKTNAADSRNIGFLNSKSDYVFFLDSDDHFISNYIDDRIILHKESKAGVIFGNFITKLGNMERRSVLPNYSKEDMRDYILIKKGDFRSSVISIDKKYHKHTLFNSMCKKHQDWIFAFTCWDNGEEIKLDKQYGTVINVERASRMSSSMNIVASEYLCDKYLNETKHINHFSKNNWNKMIYFKDYKACKFFISIYKPKTMSERMVFEFYRLISRKFVLPLSGEVISLLKSVRFLTKSQ
ncbi:glycosyltransferase [Psychrobacter namhaensis]|uniref:glycosyltransferase family 2 protein n=1 Tax=Psychrobacter namhaensis TaxID=292734 RepID=UPI003CFE7CD2